MRLLVMLILLLLARGSTFAQSDTLIIDNGITVKKYLISQIDSITFYVPPPAGIGTEDDDLFPDIFKISPNYPNPFNPVTKINCSFPGTGTASARVYDINGRLVKEIFSGETEAGEFIFSWDGRNTNGSIVSSGTYLFCIEFNSKQLVNKVIYLK